MALVTLACAQIGAWLTVELVYDDATLVLSAVRVGHTGTVTLTLTLTAGNRTRTLTIAPGTYEAASPSTFAANFLPHPDGGLAPQFGSRIGG